MSKAGKYGLDGVLGSKSFCGMLRILLCFTFLIHFVQSSPLSGGPWGPTDPVAADGATVVVNGAGSSKLRVTVLTDRLLRIERSGDNNGSFEDRKTVAVINRKLEIPSFTTDQSNGALTIQTKCLNLTYSIGEPFSKDTLQVTGKIHCSSSTGKSNGDTGTWSYHYGQDDPLNLLGTIRTLDGQNVATLNCSQVRYPFADHCEWGLVSRSGFAIVNDTTNYGLSGESDWWDGPNQDLEDLYILGHGHDYSAALSDYRLIGGFIPLLPRYALGVWFSRWYDYTAGEAAQLVKEYELRTLPLDVLVLDMNWHKKNDWTGYSFDRKLYGSSEEALAYVKSRGLAVTLNLHDASGVNPWEDKYTDMCAAIGCTQGDKISFSVVNETVVYALEDIVLNPLEDVGVNFWWIDWQNSERSGGAAGFKMNPTIWTAHVRSTNANRRSQQNPEQGDTLRNMVLSRWGGLGAHRYPVHFSGDFGPLSWDQLSYLLYFSMTATNVGAIWSHDVQGPPQDPELYVRRLQWGVLSGVMRSHERGMGAGRCVAKDTCSIVVPWDAAPKYAQASMEALRLRGSLVPYLYTAAYNAHKTGQWFTSPLYYKWPELDGAYETANPRPDPNSKYESQFLLGGDIWAAPVVKPANSTDELARLKLWVPPGLWVGTLGGDVLKGSDDGASSIDFMADLKDIPLFARAGSIIPTIPIRPGRTLGLAMKPFDELIWNVYLADGAPISGSGTVYEDDGMSTAYHDRKSFTVTTATYNISNTVNSYDEELQILRRLKSPLADNGISLESTTKTITFTVSTSGHCDKLPTTRATTIRLVNTAPPDSVVVNGLSLPFARFGGQGTWSYESKHSAVKVELPVSQVAEGLQVELAIPESAVDSGVLDGIGFKLQRAISAKAALDEIRRAPGSQTGQDKLPGSLLLAASAESRLEYLAGLPSKTDFNNLVSAYRTYLVSALGEVQEIDTHDDHVKSRVARAVSRLQSALS